MSQAAAYTYSLFKDKEGSKHIAKENCLKGIVAYIRNRRIKNILEVGIGIGTIPFVLIEAKKRGEIKHDFTYSGTEANSFCIDAVKKNVPDYMNFIKHFHSLSDVVDEKVYDLIIVDGSDKSFSKAVSFLSRGGMILVEGGRRNQLLGIKEQSGNRKYLKSSHIALSIGHLGGYSVFFFEPSFIDYVRHIKNKISTFIIYRAVQVLKKI